MTDRQVAAARALIELSERTGEYVEPEVFVIAEGRTYIGRHRANG